MLAIFSLLSPPHILFRPQASGFFASSSSCFVLPVVDDVSYRLVLIFGAVARMVYFLIGRDGIGGGRGGEYFPARFFRCMLFQVVL